MREFLAESGLRLAQSPQSLYPPCCLLTRGLQSLAEPPYPGRLAPGGLQAVCFSPEIPVTLPQACVLCGCPCLTMALPALPGDSDGSWLLQGTSSGK